MMVFDHLHEMFVAHNAPLWFKWIGRPVLPLFIFLCVEGFTHTRSKKIYIVRLFAGFELMNVIATIVDAYMPNKDVVLMNNVFQTLFFAALYMAFIEMLQRGIAEKRILKILLSIALMLLPIALGLTTLLAPVSEPRWAVLLYYRFIPSVIATEGGFSAVLLGIIFYIFRKRRWVQILFLAAFSVLTFVTQVRAGNAPFSGGEQWLMVLAILPMALYNGARGGGNKYFFYIFYPAHIYVLYIIAWFIR